MGGPASRPGVAPAATAAAILAQCALGRLLLDADQARVYVLGRPITWECALRRQYGLPCPTCGITRSLVFTLHGDVGAAWRMAPVGPVEIFGLLAFCAALLVLAAIEWKRAGRRAREVKTWIRRGTLAWAGASMVVWIGGWAATFLAAWHAR